MIEYPESHVISDQIKTHLIGKVIKDYEILHTPHRFAFFKGDLDNYSDYLIGQEVIGSRAYGGTIQIDLTDHMIAFADGAYPRYYDSIKQFPQKHQFKLLFEDNTAIFVSIQMYGEIFIFPQGQCSDGYYLSSSMKPDPLSDAFSFSYFTSLLPSMKKKLSAKAFLATEQRIPGVGNGVLQDILWNAGIDPRCPVDETILHNLYQSTLGILRQMVELGGRNTEKTLLGEYGGYITQLSKNSLHEPCMRCGYEIQKANYMGGTIYFCEHCQCRNLL